MEFEEIPVCSNFTGAFSENRDIHSIESRVQSMSLDNEVDMLESSDVNAAHLTVTGKQILHSSVEAFLQFQKEREDTTFSRTCLFCKKHFIGNRSLILEHFTEQHNFFIGQPDNLVFINEFLDILEEMLNKLQCLFCKKIFKDWLTLKEHMRKKMHKRINPSDNTFDKFYMTNYLNVFDNMSSKTGNTHCEMRDQSSNQSGDQFLDVDDDREIEVEPKDSSIICLYCDCKFLDFDEIMYHLKVVHDFDFKHLKKEYKLCFYSQIKLINFIRMKVLTNSCTICDTQFSSKEVLLKHMTDSGHIKLLPDRAKWDQSEFYFSTLDTDYLLCGLQDDGDDDADREQTVEIICEDIVLPKSSILIDENLRRTLL